MSGGIASPVRSEEQAKMAPFIATCPKCRAAMTLSALYPHPRFPRVEILSFRCECGVEERRVVAQPVG